MGVPLRNHLEREEIVKWVGYDEGADASCQGRRKNKREDDQRRRRGMIDWVCVTQMYLPEG